MTSVKLNETPFRFKSKRQSKNSDQTWSTDQLDQTNNHKASANTRRIFPNLEAMLLTTCFS